MFETIVCGLMKIGFSEDMALFAFPFVIILVSFASLAALEFFESKLRMEKYLERKLSLKEILSLFRKLKRLQ